MISHPRLARLSLALVVPLVLAACSAADGSPVPSPTASPTSPPEASSPPPGGGTTDPGPGQGGSGGGSEPGNPGGPMPGQPQVVVPKPGQQMVRTVGITELVAQVDGRRVVLNATWWSGVEPCNVLDSVDVARDGTTFTITLREGTSDPDQMCIAIAVEKLTVIDLGELEPGTYTIKPSEGEAKAITVTVP